MDSQPQDRHFQKQDAKLDHELHNGDQLHAASNLLHEFKSNPKEALALIQKQMERQQSGAASNDKAHLSIQSNGDVIVWDQGEHTGYFAGQMPVEAPKELPPPVPQQPVEQPPVEQPAPPAAPLEKPCPDAVPPVPPVVSELPPPPPPGPQPYEYEQPHHRGFHIPFPIDIGVRHGSLHLGVNVLGLVKGGVTLGAQNRGYVGSDALKTVVSAGVDLNKNHIGPAGDWHVLGDGLTGGSARVGIDPKHGGINVGAGADASLLGHNVGAGGHGGLEIGQRLGPHADGYAFVGPARASAEGWANLSDQGLKAGANVDAGAEPYVGAHAQARVGLGAKNEAHADAGVNVGDNGVSAGAGVYPQYHPDVYGRAYSGKHEVGVGLIPLRAWKQDADDFQQ